jgi:hypothetical protein
VGALVRSLRDQGINVRVHVVGFDVSQDERDQLVCIAEAGDGKYFSADNAEQLTVALTEVKQQIVAAPAPESKTTTKRVIKVGTGSIKVLNAEGFIYIVDPESGKDITNTMKDRPVQLPVGTYKLRLDTIEIDDVEVKAGEETEIVLE